MPNREERRNAANEKRLYVEDADGNGYTIYMRDISAKDENDFANLTQGTVGLCDLFLEGKVSLQALAGLIWAYRRKNGEKKLQLGDVMEKVNMACIETMDLDDGTPEEDDDSPENRLRQMREGRGRPPGNGDTSSSVEDSRTSSPSSEPSTA